MTETRKRVVIVGAGICGVSTAIWLQRDGHEVILVDKAGPAEGTSYGNAGVLASASVVPVTVPGLLKKAPKMLLDPNQPLFLRWSYLPKLLPWLIRYLKHANAADTLRIADALFPIIGDSLADHQALAAGTGAEKWIAPSDFVSAYRDRSHYEGDTFGWSIRRKLGFEIEELEGAAFTEYDASFGPEIGFGVRVGGHGHIKDPGRYVKDLAAHVENEGGRLVIADVTDVVRDGGRAVGVRAGGETIDADAVVITTGIWSGSLLGRLGVKVPLESERGYHLEFWEPSRMPKAPTMVASGKFVATPMDGRLRLAGIVEFGGTEAPPSRAPVDFLKRQAELAFPGLRYTKTEEWMGHRPAPADSIPIIGELPGVKNAYTGFGHHHVGLTGGPKTGRLLSQLIAGRQPNLDLARYSPSRF